MGNLRGVGGRKGLRMARSDDRRTRASWARTGLVLAAASVLMAGCSTGGTPSVGQPPVTVTSTVVQTTTVRTSATVTETVTQTPAAPTTPAATLVVPTFADPSTFECTDPAAVSCWQLSVVTGGPCPNGVYVAITVNKPDDPAVLTTLNATSAAVTDALGGTVVMQLTLLDPAYAGQTLNANVAEARCA